MNPCDLQQMIAEAGFGCLATTDGGRPRVRPVVPYCTDEGALLIALLSRSRSIAQVQRDPNIEICFVDKAWRYIRVVGLARLTDDRAKKSLIYANLPILQEYYGSIDDPNFFLLEILIEGVESLSPGEPAPVNVAWTQASRGQTRVCPTSG